MSKEKSSKGFFDTALKGILGVYFGSKLVDKVAKQKAMRDPEVKKSLQKLKQKLDDFDDKFKDIIQKHSN